MTPLGATLTATFCLLILLAPRRWAALATIASVCYLTQGQQFYVFGSHFTAVRIALAAGFFRCVFSGGFKGIRLNGIDKAVICYALTQLLAYTIREKSFEAFVYVLGCAYDILLSYFVIRVYVSSLAEAEEFFRGLAILIIPLAMIMMLQALTGHNLFRAMGGHGWDTEYFREGRIRAVGSFRGPHTSGIFGGALVPLFIGLWFVAPGMRLISVAGILAGGLITFSSNSSGPLLAFVSGFVGLVFWQFRRDMKFVRRGLVVALIALHLVMKAPVWFLFMKLGALTGGDGWTRSYVIDCAIRYFSEWWLVGTSDTGKWMGENIAVMDITNQYVASAINGGALGLFFYVLIIVLCFRNLGLACAATSDHSAATEKMLWCMGCTLFAHLMAQFTVSYFDQIHVAWWGLLAIISSTTQDILHEPEPNQTDPLVESEAETAGAA